MDDWRVFRSLPAVGASAALVAITFLLLIVAAESAHAQTFTALHNFTGGGDGSAPFPGTLDAAGNFYGATLYGGSQHQDCGTSGCGTAFRLTEKNSAWVLSTLYNFSGGNDGAYPRNGPNFGPDGTLYGTTTEGGNQNCSGGCGIVYKLQPPASICHSILCPWTETILHSFNAGEDGATPSSGVSFDASGNLYGTTTSGGGSHFCQLGCGIVYKLSPSNGGWSENIIYDFVGGVNGYIPQGGVVASAGNLFGTCYGPAEGGSVFELTPNGSGWTQSVYYSFQNSSNGITPIGLVVDSAGNLYGGTESGGINNAGTVYELSPAENGPNFTLLYSLPTILEFNYEGVSAPLTMDAAGNLYGATNTDGQYGYGNVFKLTPSNGSWSYTSLHDFTGGSDGAYAQGPVLLDAQGNVYATALSGGQYNQGVAFKITQ